MGRPFILYEDPCFSGPSPSSSSYQTYDLWVEAARKALEEGILPGEGIDSSSPGVSAILEYLFSKRRLAYLPNCEPAPHGGVGLLESKIGGLPYLPPSESWPCNNGECLTHLWQLKVSELPPAVQQALGYNRGLMQVFLSENLDESDGKWYVVRVLDEEQLVYRDASEIVVPPNMRILDELQVTSYTCAYDFPHMDDAIEGMPEGMDPELVTDVIDVLQEHDVYGTVAGDKLLGWPRWCQNPEWRVTDEGEIYVQLIQIEGMVVPFIVGDSGTLLLQRHPTDRQQWDVSWACL